MNPISPEAYAALLLRTFSADCPPDDRPRTREDVTDKGEPLLEFLLPHPTELRFSISLEVAIANKTVSHCALRFGQATVAKRLSPEDALSAIREVLDSHIVAIVRYKDGDAYDDHRVAGGHSVWLYQLPDGAADLVAMEKKLSSPAGFWDKLRGQMTGVFEVYRWNESKKYER